MFHVALLVALGFTSLIRDNGQFAQADPAIRQWFNGLASKNGPCCSFADGYAVDDPDWKSDSGRYSVFYRGEWREVPDEAVISGPNRIGHAVVWPVENGSEIRIRCFMPGAEG